MIKAIIFDFFGVIGLSTYQLVIDGVELSDEQHFQLKDLHKAYDNGFMDKREFYKDYAAILDISQEEFTDRYNNSLQGFGYSKPAIGIAQELRKDYKVALLSNVEKDSYEAMIKPLIENFDVIVTSYSSRLAKPDVAIFEHTAQKLGVDVSECVMIDDNELNCQGARAAGMQAITFKDVSQARQELDALIGLLN